MSNIDLPSPTVDLIFLAKKERAKNKGDFLNRTDEFIEQAEKRYRRYLALVKKHGGSLAPTRDIDAMWHLHMLRPGAYEQDCRSYFGRMLDHQPCGDDEASRTENWNAFDRAARLWEQEYGAPYYLGGDYDSAAARASCLCSGASCWDRPEPG
ncbi:glycine-rich domain-containing protein-like [Cupriavidus sp. AcVe19-6a]|uniref:glycine-rich domain-containing protein n=1 Tax=Cupriavidus sp. AcVe19-6a TaxID=2821358 RepID=UPI001AE2D5BE|nr:glycine-rich domain-containing protein-like [Cupriavidus sp. AcVe19-6a]MBP0635910.1 glycine-rich domain-containing protein-like [Cupriavidus sp. AcVe19-6a]